MLLNSFLSVTHVGSCSCWTLWNKRWHHGCTFMRKFFLIFSGCKSWTRLSTQKEAFILYFQKNWVISNIYCKSWAAVWILFLLHILIIFIQSSCWSQIELICQICVSTDWNISTTIRWKVINVVQTLTFPSGWILLTAMKLFLAGFHLSKFVKHVSVPQCSVSV